MLQRVHYLFKAVCHLSLLMCSVLLVVCQIWWNFDPDNVILWCCFSYWLLGNISCNINAFIRVFCHTPLEQRKLWYESLSNAVNKKPIKLYWGTLLSIRPQLCRCAVFLLFHYWCEAMMSVDYGCLYARMWVDLGRSGRLHVLYMTVTARSIVMLLINGSAECYTCCHNSFHLLNIGYSVLQLHCSDEFLGICLVLHEFVSCMFCCSYSEHRHWFNWLLHVQKPRWCMSVTVSGYFISA